MKSFLVQSQLCDVPILITQWDKESKNRISRITWTLSLEIVNMMLYLKVPAQSVHSSISFYFHSIRGGSVCHHRFTSRSPRCVTNKNNRIVVSNNIPAASVSFWFILVVDANIITLIQMRGISVIARPWLLMHAALIILGY